MSFIGRYFLAIDSKHPPPHKKKIHRSQIKTAWRPIHWSSWYCNPKSYLWQLKGSLMVAMWVRSAPVTAVVFFNVTIEVKIRLIRKENVVEWIEMLSYTLNELKPLTGIVRIQFLHQLDFMEVQAQIFTHNAV